MAFSPTEKLLLACAGTKGNQKKISSLLKEEIDWEYLIKFASRHQITPLLYHNLKHYSIPDEYKNRLKTVYMANLAHNLRIDAEQNKIFKLLDENNIDFIPLKGTVLAKLVYDDIALRQTSDIDFLVREKDLYRTREILLGNGFSLTSHFSDDYWLKDSCHLVVNKQFGAEIHWNIIPFNNTGVPADFAWREIQPASLKDKKFCYFNPEMLLVFTLLKYQADSFNSLKYLVDINEILNKYGRGMDWEKLCKILKKYQMKRVLSFCINSLEKMLETDLSWIIGRHKSLIAKCINVESMVKNPSCRYFERLILMDNWFMWFSLIFNYFFLHPDKLRSIYRLEPGNNNLFWYYLAYPFRVLFGARRSL